MAENLNQTTPDTSTGIVPVQGAEIRVTNVNVNALTTQEKERYNQISKSLVVEDINSISNYGSELSGIISQNSDALLNAVRNTNGNEVTAMTTELLSQLDMIDLGEINEQDTWKKIARKIPILKRFVPSIEAIMTKYETIGESVEKLSNKIDGVEMIAKRDNNALEEIYNNNKDYVRQIGDLIAAAQVKLEEVNDQLLEMRSNPDKYEIYDMQDVADFKNDLEKKIQDMQGTQYTMKMNLLQIRAIQKNNLQISRKAQTFVSTIMPIWKNQLAISLMMDDQKKNAEAIRALSDATNKIIEQNANLLKTNSILVAKENERGIFDLSTLEKTTNLMIETVKEVEKIHKDGNEMRKKFSEKVGLLENTMNHAITSSIDAIKSERQMITGEVKTLKELQGVEDVPTNVAE